MTGTWIAALGAGAALVTAVLVEIVRRLSVRLALLDRPNHRSSHVMPTPRLGGLGVAACLLSALVWLASTPLVTVAQAGRLRVLAGVGLIVSLVSLLDDVRSLAAPLRLLVHVGAAVAVLVFIGAPSTIEAGTWVLRLPVALAVAITGLWIAGFINAFNFMDGSDGIAGVQAAVAGFGWVVLGWLNRDAALMASGTVLVGSMAGFLVHNWSPARIFLGDAGSALLGFLLATLPWAVGAPGTWLPSVLLLWPFVFDTTVTLARRAWQRQRLWQAHRSHLYQRLIIGGWSHRAVAVLYATLASFGLVAAVSLEMAVPLVPTFAMIVIVLSAAAIWRVAQAASPMSPGR